MHTVPVATNDQYMDAMRGVIRRRRRRLRKKRPRHNPTESENESEGSTPGPGDGGGGGGDPPEEDPTPDLTLTFGTATGGELSCLDGRIITLAFSSGYEYDSEVFGSGGNTIAFTAVVAPDDPGEGDPADHRLTGTVAGSGGFECAFSLFTGGEFIGSGTLGGGISFTVTDSVDEIVGVLTET
jgi:hypothetical protein